jgi:fructoselysine-6-P-deglycase FrlB-like protein
MSKCDAIVFAGRDVMQGVAQSAALSLMELARVTAIGLESGQFRHGPFEFLRPGIGVVLLRSAGADKNSIASIAATCIDAGCTTIVLDASGDALDCECTQVQFPMRDGLAAAAQFLLSLQHFNIVVAKRNIAEAIGTPRFTSKVTI